MSVRDDAAYGPCVICGEAVMLNIPHCMLILQGRGYPAHEPCCAESDDTPCETHRPVAEPSESAEPGVREWVDDSWMKTQRLFTPPARRVRA